MGRKNKEEFIMTNFIKEHKNIIIGIGIALVIITAGLVGYFGFYKPYQDKQTAIAAQEQLDKEARQARVAEEKRVKAEAEEKLKAEFAVELEEAKKKSAAKKIEDEKKAAADKIEQDKKDAAAKAEEDKITVSGGDVNVNKPVDGNDKDDKPTVSKPVEKPKPEVKPQPEQNRTPATTQFDQVIDTSLSSGGHNHGEESQNSDGDKTYWHVGVQRFILEESWIYGRWASHPEGTDALYMTWADKGVSPFQEHGDLDATEHIRRGEKFYWCSYCGRFLRHKDYSDYESYYKYHAEGPEHQKNVKAGYNCPRDF